MSTKRDLVEAHSFSRRRLVTAFVSGAPGGREVEPVRPGRTILGGVAIAVLLVAGAAVAGLVSPRTPADWLEPGLRVAKDNGAQYVITEKDGELHQVPNTVSAQLILSGKLDVKFVSPEDLLKQDIGDDLGIFEAPGGLPPTSRLVDEGWTACTNEEQGIKVRIDDEPGVEPVPGAGAAVTLGSQTHLVATGLSEDDETPTTYRFRINTSGTPDDVLNSVGIGAGFTATPVKADWLNLFADGGELSESAFGVTGKGKPLSYATSDLGSAKVGDVAISNGAPFLLGDKGPMPLTDFAYAAYKSLASPAEVDVPSLGVSQVAPTWPSTWPQDTLTPVDGELCGVLMPRQGDTPTVLLGSDPTAGASSESGSSLVRSVDSSVGAYVLSGSHASASGGQPFVIDGKGLRYQLGGERPLETASFLGYGKYQPRTVPDSWVELFECGPQLSREAALERVDREPKVTCS